VLCFVYSSFSFAHLFFCSYRRSASPAAAPAPHRQRAAGHQSTAATADIGGGDEGDDGSAAHPLHAAALSRDPALVSLLLSQGHRPQDRDPLGRTALHCAAQARDPRCIRALAAPPGRSGVLTQGDSRGRTALHWAAAGGAMEVVRALLQLRGYRECFFFFFFFFFVFTIIVTIFIH
jgi:ankyrin repeat protein